MESEGEGGFLRGSRDGIDRAPQVVNSPLGNSNERERGILNEKSALWTERESCFPSDGCSRNSTLDLDYISKKVRSRPFHTLPAFRLGGVVIWSGFSLSFVVDAEPAAQWAGAAATWTPSFLLLPALSRAEPEFFIRKGRQSPKAAIPIGQRAERGEGPAIIPPRSKMRVPFR